MAYFVEHLPYIIVAAVVIAAFAVIYALAAGKNASEMTDEEKKKMLKSACAGCSLVALCGGRPEKCPEADKGGSN